MSFTRIESYPYYPEYKDSIDNLIKNKTLTIDKNNIVIKGEDKSQFIPFLMDRYYKGVDLSTKAIRIHYLNAAKNGDYSEPINVEKDEEQIRFGWLVPLGAVIVQGDLQVSVEIIGENSKNEDYVWKSYIYYMAVEKALDVGEGVVVPDENWYVAFTRQVDELNKRINEITNSDGMYGAEIHDARVDDQGVVHDTMNQRFQSDLTRMYNKKNYELIEMNKGHYYKVWVGTQAEYDSLDDVDPEIDYHITDKVIEDVAGTYMRMVNLSSTTDKTAKALSTALTYSCKQPNQNNDLIMIRCVLNCSSIHNTITVFLKKGESHTSLYYLGAVNGQSNIYYGFVRLEIGLLSTGTSLTVNAFKVDQSDNNYTNQMTRASECTFAISGIYEIYNTI